MHLIDERLDKITRPSTNASALMVRSEVSYLLRDLRSHPPLHAIQATRCLQVLDAHGLDDPALRAWLQEVKLRSPPLTARVHTMLLAGVRGRLALLEVSLYPGPRRISTVHRLDERAEEASGAAMKAALLAVHEDYSVSWQLLDAEDHALEIKGRSLGLALAVAVRRALRRQEVLAGVAFTGSLTTGGRIEPVEGVTAKLNAAARAGLTEAWVPAANASTPHAQLQIHGAHTLAQVMRTLDGQGAMPQRSQIMERRRSGLGANALLRPRMWAGALIALTAGLGATWLWPIDVDAPPNQEEAKPTPTAPTREAPPMKSRPFLELCLFKEDEPVAPDEVFRQGETLRLKVTPPAPGWVTLYYVDPQRDHMEILYPGGLREALRLDGKTVTLPQDERSIEFNGASGHQPLFLHWDPGLKHRRIPRSALEGAPSAALVAQRAGASGVLAVEAAEPGGMCTLYPIEDSKQSILLRTSIHYGGP